MEERSEMVPQSHVFDPKQGFTLLLQLFLHLGTQQEGKCTLKPEQNKLKAEIGSLMHRRCLYSLSLSGKEGA